MNLNILHIAGLIAIFQSILLAIFLLHRKKDIVIRSKILAALLIIYAILVLSSIFGNLEFLWNRYPYVNVIGNHFVFLVGPLFYFYIQSLFSKQFSFNKEDIVHIIPFTIFLIYTISIIKFYGFRSYYRSYLIYFDIGILLQLFAYLLLTIRIMTKHGIKIRDLKYSRLVWLRLLFCGFIVIGLLKLTIFLGWDVAKIITWCRGASTVLFLSIFMFISSIIYFGLDRSKIITGLLKYETSGLPQSEKQRIMNKIISYIEKEKPYLNPSASLLTFSSALSIPMSYLTQVVNESSGKSFRDFLNSYRVERAKHLLLDDSNNSKTVLQIAYEVGFNSKSTFNSAFKKHTGLTPKAFKASP